MVSQKKLQSQETLMDIPYVKTYKYLGIFLDNTLKPQPHLDHLREKMKKYKKLAIILKYQKAPDKITK